MFITVALSVIILHVAHGQFLPGGQAPFPGGNNIFPGRNGPRRKYSDLRIIYHCVQYNKFFPLQKYLYVCYIIKTKNYDNKT